MLPQARVFKLRFTVSKGRDKETFLLPKDNKSLEFPIQDGWLLMEVVKRFLDIKNVMDMGSMQERDA